MYSTINYSLLKVKAFACLSSHTKPNSWNPVVNHNYSRPIQSVEVTEKLAYLTPTDKDSFFILLIVH